MSEVALSERSSAVDSLFALEDFDDDEDSDLVSDPRDRRPGDAAALSASLTFASSVLESQPSLRQVKSQQLQQQERLQDLRQLGGMQLNSVQRACCSACMYAHVRVCVQRVCVHADIQAQSASAHTVVPSAACDVHSDMALSAFCARVCVAGSCLYL